MRRTIAETLVSFLLGAAWAIALLGALLLFWSFLPFGFLVASLAGLVGSLFGLFLVVVLETIALQFDKYRELTYQTKLLDKIEAALEDRDTDDPLRDH